MAFIGGIAFRVRSERHALSSRASSATLHLEHQPFKYTDGAADPADVSIAQSLLSKESRTMPWRRSSFTNTPSYLPLLEKDVEFVTANQEIRGRGHRQHTSSNTWSSSGAENSDNEDKEERDPFIQEYNRLAKRYNVPAIVPDGFEMVTTDKVTIEGNSSSWIMKKLLRRTSSAYAVKWKTEKQVRHKRSVSDLSLRMRPKKDQLKDKVLDELVRLCGSSVLYLPDAYAAATLHVPTCFRATAQYLVQHGPSSRGIFRIPGAQSTVNALYNHYAADNDHEAMVNGTVRCPQLPDHIKCDVHDVASAFKKFISGLPNGLLGSRWIFDALIAIYRVLDADPETARTKQSKVRARLIALAVASIPSRYERELICAVMGLLCMIGRAAETAQREDDRGRPLPTSDLMGYGPLGTVFGPLLIGELIDTYGIRSPAHLSKDGRFHTAGYSPPKSTKSKSKKNTSVDENVSLQYRGEKIRLANSIAEMLITNWREVVRHMRDLGALKSVKEHQIAIGMTRHLLRPSASECFAIRRRPDWDREKVPSIQRTETSRSPNYSSRVEQSSSRTMGCTQSIIQNGDDISVRKQRSKLRPTSSQLLSKSMNFLTPTAEENPADIRYVRHRLSGDEEQVDDTPTRQQTGVRVTRSFQTFRTAQSRPHIKFDETATPSDANPHVPSGLSNAPVSTGGLSIEPDNSQNLNTLEDCSHIHPSEMSEKKIQPTDNIPKFGEDTAERLPMMDWNTIVQSGHHFNQDITSDTNGPKPRRSQPKISIEVPGGIVQRRLRGITASDPGLQPPSGFRAFLPTLSRVRPKEGDLRLKSRYPTRSAGTSSYVIRNQSKDPLTKISQEEDLASLASLAEIIGSEDWPADTPQPATSSPIKEENLIAGLVEDVDISVPLVSEGYTKLEKSPACDKKERPQISDKHPSNFEFNIQSAEPITPQTPTINSGNSGYEARSISRSVRALAARFDSAYMGSRPSPSSSKPLASRHLNKSSFVETAMISGYITNAPRTRSQRSSKSDRSLMSSCPIPSKRRTQTSPIKSAKTDNGSRLALGSPLPLKFSPYTPSKPSKNSNLHPALEQGYREPSYISDFKSPSTIPSNLSRTGDGHASFGLPRMVSMRALLPRPKEPPVAHYINLARPPSAPVPPHSVDLTDTPFDVLPVHSPEITGSMASDAQSISTVAHVLKGRGNSLLYSQIQRLKRQLDIQMEDAEQLRRQLAAKGSTHDLGTLSEELRQTKRDLKIWKDRAEIAEKRLEILSPLHSSGDNEQSETLKQSTHMSSNSSSDLRRTENRELFSSRIKTAFQHMDDTGSQRGSPDSNGTVRRASRRYFDIYESTGQDDDSELTIPLPGPHSGEIPVKDSIEHRKNILQQNSYPYHLGVDDSLHPGELTSDELLVKVNDNDNDNNNYNNKENIPVSGSVRAVYELQ